jgi:hydroxymethylpyrimidine pyrophosphatase-like HAD family hydrolase
MSAPLSTPLPKPDDIGMIVCDVDGTLLTDTHVVHPVTVEAFRRLREAQPDLPIVIASGKQFSSCHNVREALGLSDSFPAIHAHGALLHGHGGSLLEAKPINTTALLELIQRTRGRGTFVFRPGDVVLINAEEGKDWAGVARKYDKFVEDFSGSERDTFLERIRTGEEVIVKLTVCTDRSESEGGSRLRTKY